MRRLFIIVLLLLFSGIGYGQCYFDSLGTTFDVSYDVIEKGAKSVDIPLHFEGMVSNLEQFAGFRSTFVYHYLSDRESGENEYTYTHISGIDMGSCMVGQETMIFFYANMFQKVGYSEMSFRCFLVGSEDYKEKVLFTFRVVGTETRFIVETYKQANIFKVVMWCANESDIYSIYQVTSHLWKLK